jgi:hypothetical protein
VGGNGVSNGCLKTNVGLLERYDKEIAGVLGCFDRLVVTGTLMEIANRGWRKRCRRVRRRVKETHEAWV